MDRKMEKQKHITLNTQIYIPFIFFIRNVLLCFLVIEFRFMISSEELGIQYPLDFALCNFRMFQFQPEVTPI